MTQPDREPSADSSLPTVAEEDIDLVPGVVIGTEVSVEKIDPVTGEPLLTALNFNGTVTRGQKNIEGTVRKGSLLYVLPTGEHESNHTSLISQIDRMSDGSFWLHTRNSVYRLVIGAADMLDLRDLEEPVLPVVDADRETGGTVAGAGRKERRTLVQWIMFLRG